MFKICIYFYTTRYTNSFETVNAVEINYSSLLVAIYEIVDSTKLFDVRLKENKALFYNTFFFTFYGSRNVFSYSHSTIFKVFNSTNF